MDRARAVNRIVALMLASVAVIHLLPVTGVLGQHHLTALYGLPFDERNTAILIRHRAVLFGLLGAFLLYAAARPRHHLPGMLAGLVSVLSFLWLAWSVGDYNAYIGRVVAADAVALICLVVAVSMRAWQFGVTRLATRSSPPP